MQSSDSLSDLVQPCFTGVYYIQTTRRGTVFNVNWIWLHHICQRQFAAVPSGVPILMGGGLNRIVDSGGDEEVRARAEALIE